MFFKQKRKSNVLFLHRKKLFLENYSKFKKRKYVCRTEEVGKEINPLLRPLFSKE